MNLTRKTPFMYGIENNMLLFVLTYLSIFSLQYVQLKIIPLETATRPFSIIFIFFIFFILIAYKIFITSTKKFSNYYFNDRNLKKWLIIFTICIIYIFITILIGNDLMKSIKFFINLLFAFLFYWFGYTRLGLNKERFFKLIFYSSLPIFFIGFLDIIAITIYNPLFDVLDNFRGLLLTEDFANHRLRLFFTEPSFLATYIIFLFFIVNSHFKSNSYLKKLFNLLIILFTLFGLSFNTILVVSSFIGSYYLLNYKIKLFYKILSFIIIIPISLIVIEFTIGDRISKITMDPSAYIRFLHIKALVYMTYDSYGLGMGFGSFSEYFRNFTINENILIQTKEISEVISGRREAIPYSMFFSILAQMGIGGVVAFLLLFVNMFRKRALYRHYYVALIIASISALPWGLPFIWVLLGMIDKENKIHLEKHYNEKK